MANVADVVVAALERTRFYVLVAFLVVAPATVLCAHAALLASAPTCEASLRRADYAAAAHVAETTPARAPLGQPLAQTKSLMWIEQELEKDPQSSNVVGASLVLHGNDASGPLECGSVRLDARGVGSQGGSLEPRASGDYTYFDTRYGDASQAAVRLVVQPSRHVQVARIFARANLSFAMALLSLATLAIAALRLRRVRVDIERVRDGREVERHEGGYRELAWRFGGHGTDAEWVQATLQRLRRTELLTILAACAALCGVASR